MADDLAEVRQRIEFAKGEIALLDMACKQFLFSVRDRLIRVTPTPERDTTDIHIDYVSTPPVSIASRAGIIANELRAPLDSLACTLAKRNGKTTSNVSFPISKSKEIFESDGRKKIKKLSVEDQTIIASFRPWRFGNRALFGLHALDITRKHVRLGVLGNAATSGWLGPPGRFNVSNSTGTLRDITVEGVHAERIEVFKTARLAKAGDSHLLLSGIPEGFPYEIEVTVSFEEPEEFAGVCVCEALSRVADAVSAAVKRFD